ncbi:MAG: PD-(D/E)XK nuclease family protein [Patescibacteria group bacterium]|nr:PD-(D/E)XK nuclease family protein [Patescibacteria group bacterium]
MSQYYRGKRGKNIFDPNSKESFRLSRSKIDRFFECPRCFYIDRRLGVDRPPGFPFNLNSAVDHLLKKEFDIHRAAQTKHPLMERYGLDAVPLKHPKMDEWRDALRGGVTYLHKPTNFLVTGGVDDIWVNPAGELLVVDYKATSKDGEVSLDAEWQGGYKRQMEVYQWLLRRNDFEVSNTGYFVYANGQRDKKAFDGKLEFDVRLISYEGDDSWIENAIIAAHNCLMDDKLPSPGPDCDYCVYRNAALKVIPKQNKLF